MTNYYGEWRRLCEAASFLKRRERIKQDNAVQESAGFRLAYEVPLSELYQPACIFAQAVMTAAGEL